MRLQNENSQDLWKLGRIFYDLYEHEALLPTEIPQIIYEPAGPDLQCLKENVENCLKQYSDGILTSSNETNVELGQESSTRACLRKLRRDRDKLFQELKWAKSKAKRFSRLRDDLRGLPILISLLKRISKF